MIHIGLDEARAIVDKAIEQRGEEFAYGDDFDMDAGCRYTAYNSDGDLVPACIVGLGMFMFDKNIYKWMTSDLYDFNNALFKEVAEWAEADRVFTIDPMAREYLSSAQNTQDGGRTWGVAREEAEHHVRGNRND